MYLPMYVRFKIKKRIVVETPFESEKKPSIRRFSIRPPILEIPII